jgi:hypothetical protein
MAVRRKVVKRRMVGRRLRRRRVEEREAPVSASASASCCFPASGFVLGALGLFSLPAIKVHFGLRRRLELEL